MRNGNNPNKGKAIPATLPAEIATVQTFLPHQTGYFTERFAVIKACLLSMRKFSGVPVLVWDCNSHHVLTSWLRDEYKPDYLIQSPDIGKANTQAMISRMFPAQTIIGFSDDDILYYPGWWGESTKLLKWPNAGVVSAWPVRIAAGWGTESAITWAEANARVDRADYMSEQEHRDYATSVGLNPDDYIKRAKARADIRITYQGMTAYAGAQHCQFITRAGQITKFMDYSGQSLPPQIEMDNRIDRAGLLRLTTTKRMARHMGNVIDDGIRADIKELGL